MRHLRSDLAEPSPARWSERATESRSQHVPAVHASGGKYLANQISLLGGTPKLDPDLTAPPTDVAAMLEADADARQAEQAGLIALKMKMEDQAADEDDHRQEMRRLPG